MGVFSKPAGRKADCPGRPQEAVCRACGPSSHGDRSWGELTQSRGGRNLPFGQRAPGPRQAEWSAGGQPGPHNSTPLQLRTHGPHLDLQVPKAGCSEASGTHGPSHLNWGPHGTPLPVHQGLPLTAPTGESRCRRCRPRFLRAGQTPGCSSQPCPGGQISWGLSFPRTICGRAEPANGEAGEIG